MRKMRNAEPGLHAHLQLVRRIARNRGNIASALRNRFVDAAVDRPVSRGSTGDRVSRTATSSDDSRCSPSIDDPPCEGGRAAALGEGANVDRVAKKARIKWVAD